MLSFDNNMKEILKEIGLNEREVEIYLALLGVKASTASNLAKITKINRTTTYLELENLTRLGLVSYIIKNSKRYYQAAAPQKLVEILNSKKEKVESILPRLNLLHNPEIVFKTEVFEGKGGIKTFYQDVLDNAKEILVFGATGKAMEIMKYSYPQFMKKFFKANLKEKALANQSSKKNMEKHSPKHLEVKYLPKKFYASVTTVIYANKIAIQSLQKNNIYVIIITDKNLNKTYRAYFEFMWSLI